MKLIGEKSNSKIVTNENISILITRWGTTAGMILVILVLGIMSPGFFAFSNLLEIFKQGSILTLVGLSQTAILVGGGFDLSAGAVVQLTSNLSAGFILDGQNTYLVLLIGTVIGVLIGFVNALIVNLFKIPPFVATLGTMFILSGITLAYNKGEALTLGDQSNFIFLGQGYVGPFPFIFLVLIVVLIMLHIFLKKTNIGLQMYAAGQSPQAALLRGISLTKVMMISFVIGGAIVGFAGVFDASYNYGASATSSGLDFLISALAAAFLGSTFSKTGELSVIGTTIAAMFISALSNGLILNGVSNLAMSGILGSILIISVLLSVLHKREIGQVTIF